MKTPISSNSSICIHTNLPSNIVSSNANLKNSTSIEEINFDIDEKRRDLKEKLDLEIFNHYFLGFSGNG